MSGLDEKGLRAAIFPNGENPLWTDMQRGAVDETISRVVRYLAAATPADVGEEPVAWANSEDLAHIGGIDPSLATAPRGRQSITYYGRQSKRYDVPLYSATALERVVRERDTLRARLETVEAETRERCAQIVEPKRPRPCTCERCECDKPEDAEDVGRWDGAYAAAAAIRNLEPRHD